MLEVALATLFAAAAILWGIAIFDSLSGANAIVPSLLCDVVAILAFVLGAITARSWIGAVAALLWVPYWILDGMLRAFSGVRGDSSVPVSAIAFYQGDVAWYPVFASVLIVLLAFSLRARAPLAWAVALGVCTASVVLAALGHDASMLAGLWYLAVAIDVARPQPTRS